jgi:NADH:ubiquinone oxidoreductase subunit 6 (subunit J)
MAIAAVVAAGVILVDIVIAIGLSAGGRLSDSADVGAAFGGPANVGEVFLTDHLLAFEITSIVLLVAAAGGVILGSEARKRAAAR